MAIKGHPAIAIENHRAMATKGHLAIAIEGQVEIAIRGQVAMVIEEMAAIRTILMPESRHQMEENLILLRESRMVGLFSLY